MFNTKRCSLCQQHKPATVKYFHRHLSKPDGLQSYCRTCMNNYNKTQRHNNIESRRWSDRVRKRVSRAIHLLNYYPPEYRGELYLRILRCAELWGQTNKSKAPWLKYVRVCLRFTYRRELLNDKGYRRLGRSKYVRRFVVSTDVEAGLV